MGLAALGVGQRSVWPVLSELGVTSGVYGNRNENGGSPRVDKPGLEVNISLEFLTHLVDQMQNFHFTTLRSCLYLLFDSLIQFPTFPNTH